MSFKTILLTTTLIVPLSACTLWTDFKAPETPSPKTFTGKADDVPAAWPDKDWWKAFQSPQLSAQIDQANQENYDLLAAVARVRQADAQVRIAGSALLPSVEADAGATRTHTAGGSSSGVATHSRTANAYNASLSAAYELDFWGKNYSAAESAKELAEASRFDEETVRLTTLSSVADNYFDLLATKERLRVAKESLDAAQQILDAYQKRFGQGVATGLDLAQQENLVATEQAVIPPLQQHLQQDLDAQAILLGKLPEGVDAPDAKLADMALPNVAPGLPSELLERRPDVQEAEAQLASAHANIINARAAFFPSIDLTASGGYQSAALSKLFGPAGFIWSLGASATQPIFEGGLLEGNLELAKGRYDELLQDYRKSVVSAFSDVEDALAAVQQSAAEEEAQLNAARAARDAFKLSQQQMNGGVIDITTLLNTQRALFSAEDALIQARLAHLQAIVGLYRALGGGWSKADAPPSTLGDYLL